MRARRLAVLLSVLAVGCAAARSEPDQPARSELSRDGRGQLPGSVKVPALAATELARVPAGTYGPYLAGRSGANLVLWAAPEKGERRGWYSLPLSPVGDGVEKALRIADAPREIGLVALEPAGGRGQPGPGQSKSELEAPGFIAVFSQPGAKAGVQAMALGPRGQLRGGPTLLSQSAEELLWVDAVATDRGSLVFWAVQRDDRADLFAAQIGRAAEPLGEPQTVLEGARAWQVAQVLGGAAIGVVLAGSDRGASGPVQLRFIDSQAAPVAQPVTISAEPSAGLDLDLVRVGSGLVMAWSDRRRIEPKVYLAAVDARGSITREPSPVTRGLGEEALLQLVAPFNAAGPGYLVWERVAERAGAGRSIQVAEVRADGSVGRERGQVKLQADDAVPEFRATPAGVAALTLAAACPRGRSCEAAPTLPTFVQFDRKFELVASEPMRLDALDGGAVTLSWGLSCQVLGCIALAAVESSPAPVFAVRLQAQSKTWRPAGARVKRQPPPRALSVQAVAELDPVHDVSVLRVGSGLLAAWVTYFDPSIPYRLRKTPAPDGRLAPLRALLQVQPAATAEGEAAEAQTISLRARSLAGVQLAPGRPGKDEALLVWSAIDRGQPQVFLTRVDARGKKHVQQMLTRSAGEVSDVAAASADEGWTVVWVDERDGDPEVYATHVNARLQRDAPERRLTRAAGAATGVSVHALGEYTQIVWADARDSAQPGWADIYGMRVSGSDAQPQSKEQPFATTPAHSFCPVLAALGDGLALAWLESSGAREKAKGKSGVQIAQLDSGGRLVSPPVLAPALGGTPTSLSLDCPKTECHLVISVEADARSELQAFVWESGSKPTVRKLATLTGPAGQAVAPALSGDQLYYADQTPAGQGRVFRMLVDWD